MLAKGNSDVVACSFSLLNTMQREVPFSRSKGIDPDVMDMPFDEAESYLDETARSTLAAYEPRIKADSVNLGFGSELDSGDARYTVTIIDNELDEEEGEDD